MYSPSSALAQKAYGDVSTNIRTDRSIELQAFTKATGLLNKAKKNKDDVPALAEALDFNRRLWSLLGDDARRDDNKLPAPLRAQIVSLSMFVNRHSRAVLQNTASIDALIEINTSIMRGLREE